MAVLQIKDGEEWKEIEAIIGPEGPDGPQGPKGESGVYTGTEEPSSDYDVWIEPDGTPGTIPTKTSDLTNDSGFIDKDVNTLTNYELKTNTGATIDLSIDSSTYVMTLALKNSAGTTISTDSIDLPLETMVVGASYDSQTKEIVLTLKNGNTTRFSVADLVSGLVSDTYLTTNYYNKSSVDTNIANVVTDSSSQSTTTAYSCNYVNNALKGEVLYSDATGTNGNIEMSKSAANYNYLEIYYYRKYSTTRKLHTSTKIDSPDGKEVLLHTYNISKSANPNGLTWCYKVLSISGKNITKDSSLYGTYEIKDSSTWSPFGSGTDNLYIYKIVGY